MTNNLDEKIQQMHSRNGTVPLRKRNKSSDRAKHYRGHCAGSDGADAVRKFQFIDYAGFA
jgi:hypothetical protein